MLEQRQPEHSFDPIRLERESFPVTSQTIVHNPEQRFIFDRFRTMTSREQAQFLAALDMHVQTHGLFRPDRPPLQFEEIREHKGLPQGKAITARQAADYYLEFPSSGRRLWLERAYRSDDLRPLIRERILDYTSSLLPAIPYTLAHIYEGGHYGLLTARGARSNHTLQIQTISEFLGFSPQNQLIYYVNDDTLNRRLDPSAEPGSAEKKAAVLVDYANGLKHNEHGKIEPMAVGKRFDEIIFIDDEDKNLQAVVTCLVRDVCSNLLYEAGLRHRTEGIEQRISRKAKELGREAYERNGVRSMQDLKFWVALSENLLSEFSQKTGCMADRENAIASLMQQKKWLPDVLKVLDGRSIPYEDIRASLEKRLTSAEPLALGSKRSIIFNDIDGNLLTVHARFYVTQISDKTEKRLLVLNQAEFAEHPHANHWLEMVSKETGIPVNDLHFSYEHFRDPDAIEQDILRAMYRGKIIENTGRDSN